MRLTRDMQHMTAAWDKTAFGIWLAALPRVVVERRFRAVIYFRMSQWAWMHRAKPLALWLKGRAIGTSGAEIHPAARIGAGLCLVHSTGIVVGHATRAGEDLVLLHGVTLGHRWAGGGQPTLGNRVRIGANATILGSLTIGDDARIGANAVVLSDVPSGTNVTGRWDREGVARRHPGSLGTDAT